MNTDVPSIETHPFRIEHTNLETEKTVRTFTTNKEDGIALVAMSDPANRYVACIDRVTGDIVQDSHPDL